MSLKIPKLNPGEEHYWRSMISVEEIGETTYKCRLPGWNSEEIIEFPLDGMPEELRAKLFAPSYIFGYINTGQDEAKDLRVKEYGLTIDPHLTDEEAEQIEEMLLNRVQVTQEIKPPEELSDVTRQWQEEAVEIVRQVKRKNEQRS